jgi:hypothetical protein
MAKVLEKPVELTGKARQKRIEEIKTLIKKEEKALAVLIAEDRTPYAQDIVDRMFTEFPKGAQWTNKMKKLAEEEFYVFSPIGRKRNLFAAMTQDQAIVARQVRRGTNAPIQGFASEISVKAGRVVYETYYEHLPTFCELMEVDYDPWEWRVPYNRIVHDASYYAVPFKMVIPFVHILQYDTTYGITKRYKEEFGVAFTVEPEIEIDFGARDDNTFGWDWSIPSIVDSMDKSLQDMIELKILRENKEKIMKQIFKPWANKKFRHYLQEHFPLLGVTDLDKQIVDAIRPIYKKE